jgi:hypothetical protein
MSIRQLAAAMVPFITGYALVVVLVLFGSSRRSRVGFRLRSASQTVNQAWAWVLPGVVVAVGWFYLMTHDADQVLRAEGHPPPTYKFYTAITIVYGRDPLPKFVVAPHWLGGGIYRSWSEVAAVSWPYFAGALLVFVVGAAIGTALHNWRVRHFAAPPTAQ